jgi:uncharacterized surface protein with fasciclin (FAS1) repeats
MNRSYRYIFSLLLATLMLQLSGCYKQLDLGSPNAELKNLMTLIDDLRPRARFAARIAPARFDGFACFKAALIKTGLDADLRNESNNFTVFIPDDFAFADLPAPYNTPANIAGITNPLQIAFLREVIAQHIAQGRVLRSAFGGGEGSGNSLNTLAAGPNNLLSLRPGVGVPLSNSYVDPTVNGLPILNGDFEATNGIIHFVESVMFPDNMLTLLGKLPKFSLFKYAVDRVPEVQALLSNNAEGLTLFAPTNAGMTLGGLGSTAAIDAEDVNDLRTRILSHILATGQGRRLPNSFVPANQGIFPAFGAISNIPTRVTGRNLGLTFSFDPTFAANIMAFTDGSFLAVVGSTVVWGGVDYDGITITTATNGFLYEINDFLF